MSNNSILISIVTPCYNADAYLVDCYQSIAAQSYSNWEWLVVDDKSTDASLATLRKIQNSDKRVRVFSNDCNSGAAYTRNVGLKNASGDFIAFLDSDDLWHPKKLETQLNTMVANKLNFSFHSYRLGKTPEDPRSKTIPARRMVKLENLLPFNPICTSTVMIRREPPPSTEFQVNLRQRQDYVFWFEFIKKNGPAYGLNEILGYYRTGLKKSLSSNKVKNTFIQYSILRRHFKVGVLGSVYFTTLYSINGLKKYYAK